MSDTSDTTDSPLAPASDQTPEGTAEDVATAQAEKLRPFGGLTPREAGLRRAEQRRARQEAEDEAPATPQASDVVIEDALRRKAEKGDVAAARALLDWQARKPEEGRHGDAWLELLTQEQRDTLKQWIAEARKRGDPAS